MGTETEQILGHGATGRCCEDQLPSAASGPRQRHLPTPPAVPNEVAAAEEQMQGAR